MHVLFGVGVFAKLDFGAQGEMCNAIFSICLEILNRYNVIDGFFCGRETLVSYETSIVRYRYRYKHRCRYRHRHNKTNLERNSEKKTSYLK